MSESSPSPWGSPPPPPAPSGYPPPGNPPSGYPPQYAPPGNQPPGYPPAPAPLSALSGGPFPLGRPLPPMVTAPLPPPAGVPLPPAKSGPRLRVVPTLLLLLVLGVIVTLAFVLPAIENERWKVGACLDYYPVDQVELDVNANLVDCANDEVRSVIVGVFGGGATLDDCRPLGAIASYTRNDKMYCIVEI